MNIINQKVINTMNTPLHSVPLLGIENKETQKPMTLFILSHLILKDFL